jgi:hypothetical protein
LLQTLDVKTRTGVTTHAPPTSEDGKPTDLNLLVELAATYRNLERLRRDFTSADQLERRADTLRTKLSPPTARLLDTLARRTVSPPVAALENGACGECHVRLPTALANAVVRDSTAHRCPHCKRILVPAAASPLASPG